MTRPAGSGAIGMLTSPRLMSPVGLGVQHFTKTKAYAVGGGVAGIGMKEVSVRAASTTEGGMMMHPVNQEVTQQVQANGVINGQS